MPNEDELKKELKYELAKTFHEQFANNRNHDQTLFLQILTILLTVLIGFSYLYIRVNVADDAIVESVKMVAETNGIKLKIGAIKVTSEIIYVYLAIASCLLSLAIALTLSMGLAFRRDQIVVANIRLKAGAMKNKCESIENFFPSSFNPVNIKDCSNWLPDFHKIFFIALIIIKILLILAVVCNSSFGICNICSPKTLIIGSFILIIYSLFMDFKLYVSHYRKWTKKAKYGREKLNL